MSARRVAWLLVAGAVVIAFAIWLSSRRHLERDLAAGQLVLPGLERNVNGVTTVSLKKGDATHATLKKDGSGWSVGERDWPADVTKVRKLLLNLGALNIVEEKTRLPANYPQLGVEDVNSPKAAGTLVDVVTPARTWALIIGKSSGGKSGYVRVAGTPQSLLAAPLLNVEADPKLWLETDLIDVPVERVREVEERPAQGVPFSASRDKKEQTDFTVSPVPKGRQLMGPGAADGMAAALASLVLDDVRKADAATGAPATGAPATGAPTSHAVFRTFDGLEVELAGRKDGTHSLIAISARSTAAPTAAEAQKLDARFKGWEFEIPDYKYAAIFTPLDQLLSKPPEPAAKTATNKGTTGARDAAGKKGAAKAGDSSAAGSK
jgi:Domain of unknown function (DUF4340)